MFFNYVKMGKLHGCVTFVQQGGEILHFRSYGFQNIRQNIKMKNNVIFEISSMTKIITAAGALKLVEEGKLNLYDPLKKHLPQLADLKVLENGGTDSSQLVSPDRDITIRDLLMHTAGFGYGWSNDTIDKLYRQHYLYGPNQTSENFLNTLSQIPLKYQPGSKWEYSCSIDILGFIIEKITGETLHDYLKEVFFIPLKMKSTGFYIEEYNIDRLCCNFEFVNGKLKQLDFPHPSAYLKLPSIYWGGAGIVTTAGDLANFYNMILNFGTYKGKQVLKAQTVELLISNQISDVKEPPVQLEGYGFGTGVKTDKNTGKTSEVYWQGSPYNTSFFIDFEKQLIGIFLTQNGPFGHLDIINRFEETVRENTP